MRWSPPLITAARLHIEGTTGRALLSQSWRVVLDDWPPAGLIRLPVSPLLSLTAITAYDADGNPSTLPLSGVVWDASASPTVLFLPAGFGAGVPLRERQGIELDYTAGYGSDPADVPAPLRQALLTLVAYWYENRDAVLIAGSGSVDPGGHRSAARALPERCGCERRRYRRTPALASLRDRVQLRCIATSARDDEGGTTTTFVPLATVWARVRQLTARQGDSADGRAVLLTHSVVLRYRTDLVPGDRLVYRRPQPRTLGGVGSQRAARLSKLHLQRNRHHGVGGLP